VAALLAEATEGSDVVLLMGGLLHDTLEDTDATYEDWSNASDRRSHRWWPR